jgi:hypothetical protein
MLDGTVLIVSLTALAGLLIISRAGLSAWRGWLDVKRLELASSTGADMSASVARIDLADLRERVRKLEAIAAGVDL